MEMLAEIVISLLLVLGGLFGLVGSYGLVKLDDLMRRLHAPTKATTLGVGGILIGSMIYSAVYLDKISAHELLITIFLLLTAPITANFIAKAHLHRNAKPEDLPETGGQFGWALYDRVPQGAEPIDTK